jgi:hypothetical protein
MRVKTERLQSKPAKKNKGFFAVLCALASRLGVFARTAFIFSLDR